MKILFFVCAISFASLAQNPEKIVQQQLDAYNRQDIKAFAETYSDSVEIFNFGIPKPILQGKKSLEQRYSQLFKDNPTNYAALHGRVIQGNYVIDKEYVTGRGEPFSATAIYLVEKNLIRKVWFLR
jgi:hypothetical protein